MNIRRLRPLKDLPNQDNFKFVGILADHTPVDCYVTKDAISGTYKIAGAAEFRDLIGWVLV